jgi:GNAT superfamily N-acetyltransferase
VTQHFQIRSATTGDADVIAWHRVRMFQDMGMVPDDLFEPFRAKALEHIRAAFGSGEYVGWLVPNPADAEIVIAGAGVALRGIPPFPRSDDEGNATVAGGRQALVLNVFTEPQWRRRGLARFLMQHVIGWCRTERIESVVLHASDDGSALYQQLGFIPATEMRLR